jgi:hypothetical protein
MNSKAARMSNEDGQTFFMQVTLPDGHLGTCEAGSNRCQNPEITHTLRREVEGCYLSKSAGSLLPP